MQSSLLQPTPITFWIDSDEDDGAHELRLCGQGDAVAVKELSRVAEATTETELDDLKYQDREIAMLECARLFPPSCAVLTFPLRRPGCAAKKPTSTLSSFTVQRASMISSTSSLSICPAGI
jgi:hypothetical protein